MRSKPNRLWWSALLLGWAFDFLFWKKAPGVNFTIYVLLCLLTGTLLLRGAGHRPARSIWSLMLFILIPALMTFVRLEPMTVFLSVALTLFLMGVVAVSYLGGRWLEYGLLDYLGRFLRLAGSMVARPLAFNAELKREQSEALARGEPTRTQGFPKVWPVVRGILIAIPVVAIFAALLASADLIFSQRLEAFIELFRLEDLPEYIFRGVYILAAAYALAGIFLHAASESSDEKLTGASGPVVPPFLGFTESAIVLGSVLALFTAFVIIQFQYFFGGQANIHLDGYTYSEYARRGFGELVLVAFFSLMLILVASAITRRSSRTERGVFSALGIGIVVLVLIMLISAFQRLVLYESAYGFSRLRTYTHVFMIWLALLLVAVGILELLQRERAFALTVLLASAGFVVSLGLVNVDGFIVRQNVNRTLAGEAFDASYLTELSYDAVPALAQAYRTESMPAEVREGLGIALTCLNGQQDGSEQLEPWQSFQLARWRANAIMRSLEEDLEDYQVIHRDWDYVVTTPSGEEYYCAGYGIRR